MHELPQIRSEICSDDTLKIRQILESTGYFSQEEVVIAEELALERLEKGEASGYFFLFVDGPDGPIAFGCFGPIPCTLGSYDLYWIAVHNDYRRKGLGAFMLSTVEKQLKAASARKLYIETSSREQYNDTRQFYTSRGYRLASCITDFYNTGDDKHTYVKDL